MKSLINLFLIVLIIPMISYSNEINIKSDSLIIEIYEFNLEGNNSDKDFFANGTLIQDAKLIRKIKDQRKIEYLKNCFVRLIVENDFVGNYECFMPNIGVLVKKNESIIMSFSLCLTCKKLFFYNYMKKTSGYLYFHNNNILEVFLEENKLLGYERQF